MARPRIFLTYPFPLGRATGGAKMTREIASHLGKAGAEVKVFPMAAEPSTCFPRPRLDPEALGLQYYSELAANSVSVVQVPQSNLHWYLDSHRMRRLVERAIRQARPDIVLSYYYEAAALQPMLERHGIDYGFICTWQSYAHAMAHPLRKVPRWLWPKLRRELVIEPYRRASVMFATSEFTRHELIDVLGVDRDRIEVCYLGVNPEFLKIPRPRPTAIKRLLFFGRVIAAKGVVDAIDALARLAARGDRSWRFRIVGQGNHEWARQAAAEHGIGDLVEVEGPLDDAGVLQELAQTDVAILPSPFEAFGLCFVEAQAAGVPVIAYEAGSVPEIVRHGETGWLAPVGDIATLSTFIGEALQDPAATHERGLAGREGVRSRFTWEKTAATILDRLRIPRRNATAGASGAGRTAP